MITHLSLNNFKCFADVSFPFKNLTVLAGGNGSGKSSVIQSFLLLRQSYIDKTARDKGKMLFRGEYINLGGAVSIPNFFTDSDTSSISIVNDDSESLCYRMTNLLKDEPEIDVEIEGPIDSYYDNSNLFDDNFVYLSADRLAPQGEYKMRQRNLQHYSRLGDRSGNYSVSYYYDCIKNAQKISIPDLRHPNSIDESVQHNVICWMQYIMNSTLSMGVEPTADGTGVKLNYQLDVNGSTAAISPLNVAFGNSYLFPIVLGILTAPKGSLFIIENPEAHLHPLAQIKITELLLLAAHNGVQVVVETHSNEVFTTVRYNIFKRRMDCSDVIAYYRNTVDEDFTKLEYNLNGESRTEFPGGFFDASLNMLIDMQ